MRHLIPLAATVQLAAWIGVIGCAPAGAGEYTAQDQSFTIQVPAGWRMRVGDLGGQPLYIAEPDSGGAEKILIASGFAQVRSVQELSQQAAMVAGQLVPGLQLAGGARFGQMSGAASAEQQYSGGMWQGTPVSGWHGMVLRDGSYFGVLALATPQSIVAVTGAARGMFQSVRMSQPSRNTQLERSIVGTWALDSNRSSGLGTSDSVMSMSSWRVTFYANGRFRSVSETFVDSSATGGYGGSVGSGQTHTGTYRIAGNTLIADIDGAGRQTFSLQILRGALKINGQLFLRQ